jgi:hypothetical protein
MLQTGTQQVIKTAKTSHVKFFSICRIQMTHVKWVPCHHGKARPQVADGGDSLQIWRVAANILNKQSRIADRGGTPAWGLGGGAKNPPP